MLLDAASYRWSATHCSEYTASADVAKKQELANLIIKELSQHASLEETMVYPKLKERVPDGNRLGEEAYQDHFRCERMLDELLNMKVADDEAKFDNLMNTMMTDLMTHIRHEEGQLLPLMRQYMYANELVDLGQKIESRRPMMPTHPHPNAPKKGAAGMAAGLTAAPLDRAQDAVRSALSGQ